MGATYVRQSSTEIVTGEVINASDFNDEFTQLVSAFAASTGHSHDGTAAEGGNVTKLLGTALTIGDGTAGTDIAVTFDGETTDGLLTWMEDEDHFLFSDDVVINSTERLYLFDKGGEFISGDGTDLTLTSGADINLTATADVVIPANVGVTFGTGEKIEGNNTDLTVTSGADINLTATADVNIPSGVGLTFGDDGEKIEGDGTDLTVSSSAVMTLDAGGNITIDADGGTITFSDAGVSLGTVTSSGFTGNVVGNVTGTADVATVATTVTITDNESTNESNAIIFTAGGDVDGGNIGLESDGTLTYNPSTGSITATGFVGALTGNASGTAATVTGAAQTAITSVGTLTALTVDDVAVNGKVITMTGDTGDTTVITAGAAGTLSIVTTDAAGADGHITITADGTFEADGTTITLDSAGDIDLNAGGGDIFFKEATTTFGSATNTSGNLIIKSGTTTALTFSGANLTAAGTIGSGAITSTGVITGTGFTIGSAAILEAELEILDGANLTTTELNLLDGSAKSTSSITIADSDAILIIDGTTTKQIPASDIKTYVDAISSGDATALAIALG